MNTQYGAASAAVTNYARPKRWNLLSFSRTLGTFRMPTTIWSVARGRIEFVAKTKKTAINAALLVRLLARMHGHPDAVARKFYLCREGLYLHHSDEYLDGMSEDQIRGAIKLLLAACVIEHVGNYGDHAYVRVDGILRRAPKLYSWCDDIRAAWTKLHARIAHFLSRSKKTPRDSSEDSTSKRKKERIPKGLSLGDFTNTEVLDDVVEVSVNDGFTAKGHAGRSPAAKNDHDDDTVAGKLQRPSTGFLKRLALRARQMAGPVREIRAMPNPVHVKPFPVPSQKQEKKPAPVLGLSVPVSTTPDHLRGIVDSAGQRAAKEVQRPIVRQEIGIMRQEIGEEADGLSKALNRVEAAIEARKRKAVLAG